MERCFKYIHIAQKEPSEIPEINNKLKENNCPQNGKKEFKDFYVRYGAGIEIIFKKLISIFNKVKKLVIVEELEIEKHTIRIL